MGKPSSAQREKMTGDAKRTAFSEGAALRASLPRGPGGDALLCQETIAAIAMVVSEGLPVESAAKVVGLTRTTLQRWIAEGGQAVAAGKDTLQARLCWALDAAAGDSERALVRMAMRGAESDPQVAMGILAVRRPDHWAPAQPERDDPKKLYAGMTEEELLAEVDRLRHARRGLAALPPSREVKMDGGNGDAAGASRDGQQHVVREPQ